MILDFMLRSLHTVLESLQDTVGVRPSANEVQSFAEENLIETEDGVFLRAPAWLCSQWGYPDHLEPLLLKRACYDVLTSQIVKLLEEHTTSVILLGNSGIGKSGFCLYMLWWLLHHNKVQWSMIVLKFFAGWFFIFTRDSAGNLRISREVDHVAVAVHVEREGRRKSGKVLYLADREVFQHHWLLPCKFILTCSAAKQNHWHFSGVGASELLYVPVWSWKEIFQLNKVVFKRDEAEVQEAFDMWGGIPRYVLADRDNDVRLHSKEFRISPNSIRAISEPDAVYLEANHRVFHYNVDEATCFLVDERYPLKFANHYVARGVLNAVPPSLIDSIAGGKASDKMRAAVFDTFFHYLLLRSLEVDYMEMDRQGQWGPLLRDELPSVRFEYVPETKGNDAVLPECLPRWMLDHTMIRPSSTSNRSWDLIIGRRILQATVTKRHEKRLEVTEGLINAKDFLKRCYGNDAKLEFVYFVPSALFPAFSPSLPGGQAKAGWAACVQKLTSQLDLKVKKMCFRSGSLSDVEALSTCNLLDTEDSNCRITSCPRLETFEAMELRQTLQESIKDCYLRVPTLVQQRVIGPLVAGKNVLACAPPKSGSTTGVSISVIQRATADKGLGRAIILVPDEEAAVRVVCSIRALSDARLKIHNSGFDAETTAAADWHVLVGTPSAAHEACTKLSREQVQSISMLVVLGADDILKDTGFHDVDLCLVALSKKHKPQVAVFAHSMPHALLDFVSQLKSVSSF